MKKIQNEVLIKNGRVIDPADGIDKIADVYIKDGIIVEVGKIEKSGAKTVIDASGKIVAPGLIDIHVHFREPGDEEVETIASGSMAAVAGGFTSVVTMPNTDPPVQDETSVEYVHRKARVARKTHVYVMGAITKQRQGQELAEMGLMARAGAVGFTDDGTGVQDASVMLRALKYASMFNLVVAQHCQDNSLGKSGVMNSGYNSTILGLPGMDPLAEEMMLWRDVQLVKKTGTKYHAQHISTKGSVEIIKQAKLQNLPITCEVTPHHLLLTDEHIKDYDTNYKVNPPLRTAEDIKALKHAIQHGLVDALVTDHAPHLQSAKELEFLAAPFGIDSIECALALYVKALVEPNLINWPQLIAMMTYKPAAIIGIDKGTLAPGKQGDVTIIDPEYKWKIDSAKFYSKSRNCPYQNWEVKAKPIYTIVGGEIRYALEA
jgi:dihydroorotase